MISDLKMDFFGPEEVREIPFLGVKSILTSNWDGERRGRIPKEKCMDFRIRQSWLGWLSRQCNLKQDIFFFFCHSAQDLSSWTRDQTLGLAGNRLPGNSQARHFYSVSLSFLICKVRTRASITLVIMKIKGNVCYKDPAHGNQEQMLSLFFPVALNDIQIN